MGVVWFFTLNNIKTKEENRTNKIMLYFNKFQSKFRIRSFFFLFVVSRGKKGNIQSTNRWSYI